MRNYQAKTNVGGVPDSITITKYGGGEITSLNLEGANSVIRSGQTPADASGTSEDTAQLAQSLFLHAVKSQAFQDGGSADTYEVTPVSGASGVLLPGDYDNMDGAAIHFVPGNAPTGPSTLDIGQTAGTLLGTKALFNSDETDITSTSFTTQRVDCIYDAAADSASGAWLLLPKKLQENVNATLAAGFYITPTEVTTTSSSLTPVFINRNQIEITINQAFTLGNPAVNPDGGMALIYARQDATGFAFDFGTNYNVISGSVDTSPNAVSMIWLYFNTDTGAASIDVIIEGGVR